MMAHPLQALLDSHPLVAILRGIRPEEAVDVAEVLLASGFRCIEVPLNSPSPLESLNRLAAKLGDQMILGAGTVLNAMQVDEVVQAGAKWVLAPNCNRSMIERAVDRGLLVMPGVATPTEAFDALNAGAQALKLFPADVLALAPLAVEETKKSINEMARGVHDESRLRARERLTGSSADFAEGRSAFAERRKPNFTGR